MAESAWEEVLHQHEQTKERAAILFDGLRDLPVYGQRMWEGWFRRTFDAYNRLWKFQQEHRQTLEMHGGLRRHHIGETASRIGQLYYHFYLRKGDTCYLDEAFTFYDFIRQRRYFAADSQCRGAPPPPPPDSRADDETRQQQLRMLQQFERQQRQQKHALALRELRYYTRFAVVCLLLEKRSTLRPLLAELRELVITIGPSCAPHERAEWNLVLHEFDAFSQIERPLATRDSSISSIADALDDRRPHRRLRPDALRRQAALVHASARLPVRSLVLSEAILVGACASQAKVSELTIDVFRMLFMVEWDVGALKATSQAAAAAAAAASGAPAPASSAASAGVGGRTSTNASCMPSPSGAAPVALANPHKYLLHRTTAPQLLLVLATALSELPSSSSAVLLYLSADGIHAPAPPPEAPIVAAPVAAVVAQPAAEPVAAVAAAAAPPPSAEPAMVGGEVSIVGTAPIAPKHPPMAKLERSNSGNSSNGTSTSANIANNGTANGGGGGGGGGGVDKEDKGDTSSVATLVSSSSSGRSSPIASLLDGSASVSPAQVQGQEAGLRTASAASDGSVASAPSSATMRTAPGSAAAVAGADDPNMAGAAAQDGARYNARHSAGDVNLAQPRAVMGGVALAVPSASAGALRNCCLSPHDLVAFARMPLFLVVDSDNAHAFAPLPALAASFAQHTLCLLSPGPASPYEHAARKRAQLAGGGALTLFLNEPVAALCALCELAPPSALAYGEAEAELADACCALTAALLESPTTPSTVLSFLADPFLRTLMLRFILCDAAFHSFRPTKRLLAEGKLLPPRCVPKLPLEAARESVALLSSLRRVAEALEIVDCFDFER